MSTNSFDSLPDDVVKSIILWLPLIDRLRFGSTCKQLHNITQNSQLWRSLDLQLFTISKVEEFPPFKKFCSTVVNLDLSRVSFKETTSIQAHLVFFLEKFTALQRLSLAYTTGASFSLHNRIDPSKRPEPFTRPQLKVLNLSNRLLNSDDLLNICMICPHLTTLLLPHCRITDGGLEAIAHKNPQAEEFGGGFSTTNQSLWPYSGPCFPPDETCNSSLEILDISFGQWHVTKLNEVLPRLPNLKELYAVGYDIIPEVPGNQVCIIQHDLWRNGMSEDVIGQFRSHQLPPLTDVNQKNPNDGKTLLHMAVIAGNFDMVKLLVEEFGADVNAAVILPRPSFGLFTFSNAHERQRFNTPFMVSWPSLIEGNAPPDGPFETKQKPVFVKSHLIGAGVTPLHEAAVFGRDELCEYLIAHGANLEAEIGEDGMTPLILAVQQGHKATAQLLVEKGAEVNHPDSKGKSKPS